MDGSSALNHVINSLGRALSLGKLLFFLLGAAVTLLLCFLILWIGNQGSDGAGVGTYIFAFLIATGLFGVIAGGVVYIAHEERQGQSAGIMQTVFYCLRRFLAFFGGALLMFVLTLLVPALFNGLIYWLRDSGDAGSFITAILFLPQLLINLCLVVGILVTVIVFCAMVIEPCGPFRALGRLLHSIRHQTGPLIVQLIMSIFFGGVVFWALVSLVGAATVPTVVSNGPKTSVYSLMKDLMSLDDTSSSDSELDNALKNYGSGGLYGFGGEDKDESSSRRGNQSDSGDSLRSFAQGLVVLLVLAYPFVFWIVSFTGYYEQNQPMSSPAPSSAIPPPPNL